MGDSNRWIQNNTLILQTTKCIQIGNYKLNAWGCRSKDPHILNLCIKLSSEASFMVQSLYSQGNTGGGVGPDLVWMWCDNNAECFHTYWILPYKNQLDLAEQQQMSHIQVIMGVTNYYKKQKEHYIKTL